MSLVPKRQAAIVGAGPAGLAAAETLAEAGFSVTIYERMGSPARKLLLAGRGGLNLTHSEPLGAFLPRYREAEAHIAPAITAFSPDDLRAWADGLGQATFVGTSGRVFPACMKTSPLLRAWLARLAGQGVRLETRHTWQGFTPDGGLSFSTPSGEVTVRADVVLLALGGASWPQLGSDGAWVPVLAGEGIGVAPLLPSNAGFLVSWSAPFEERAAGAPLKRIALRFGPHQARGEAVITAAGLEGGALYALSAPLRAAVLAEGGADLMIDLRPDETDERIALRLTAPRGKQSLATYLRKALRLAPHEIALLQEAAHAAGSPLGAIEPLHLARLVKSVPVRLTGLAPIARAISSAGGVRFDELDERFMLVKRPGVFVAGEMIDWEAPTGGYLLQAAFATGRAAARGAVAWLAHAGQDAGREAEG